MGQINSGASGGRPPHGGRGLKSLIKRKIGARNQSSPSRGTWIEMQWEQPQHSAVVRRPPHGGRGLKSNVTASGTALFSSSPSRGTWIEIFNT